MQASAVFCCVGLVLQVFLTPVRAQDGHRCRIPIREFSTMRLLGATNRDLPLPLDVSIDTQLLVTCDPGYTLIDGSRVAICNYPGTWSNRIGRCARSRMAIDMGHPPQPDIAPVRSVPRPAANLVRRCLVASVDHGRVTAVGAGGGSEVVSIVPAGAMVALICDSGYRLTAGQRTTVCTVSGQWSTQLGRCVPSDHFQLPPRNLDAQDNMPASNNTIYPSWAIPGIDFPIGQTNSKNWGCGRATNNIGFKIFGGHAAAVGAFPWMARLQSTYSDGNTKQQMFGGTLISSQWILTTATRLSVPDFDELKIYMGSNFRRTTRIMELPYKQIVFHPFFNRLNPYMYNFALIELNYTLASNRNIQPICLPDFPNNICDDFQYPRHATTIDGCSSVTAVGWGLTENSEFSFPNELRHVNLSFMSFSDCQSIAGDLTQYDLCAGGETGRDTCNGDSGGPLICIRDDRHYLVGVTSSSPSPQCGTEGIPSIYGRVCSVLPWIRETIEKWYDNDENQK